MVGAAASQRRFLFMSGCPTPWKADSRFGPDPRGNHGDGGRLHGGAVARDLRARADGPDRGCNHRNPHGSVCRNHRIAQTDIKKVLAYSTVSQLGYMFMACGRGAFSAGIFHLMTHAFFKACSSSRRIGDSRSRRRAGYAQMGGLRQYMPVTFVTMGIATLAIAGIPPFAGFWSKDEILWQAFGTSWVYWLIGVITAFITSFICSADVHDIRRRVSRQCVRSRS